MNNVEKQILENAFDSLDRLFDSKCEIYDVCDLLLVTDIALKSLNSQVDLSKYFVELNKIVQREISEENKREEALEVTDSLRALLDGLLPM